MLAPSKELTQAALSVQDPPIITPYAPVGGHLDLVQWLLARAFCRLAGRLFERLLGGLYHSQWVSHLMEELEDRIDFAMDEVDV